MNIDTVRKNYPILEKGIFLNHAATAPVSYGTIEQMKSLCDMMRDPLGKHFYKWLALLEETRRYLAELLHASVSEIAITQNTSSSLSIIAGSIDFKPGDRVLVPRDEFPSNRYVWQNLESQGVTCHFFDIENDRPLLETLEKLDLTNVRLISLSLISYLTGKKHDLKTFGTFCRNHNIFSCVDAIQAVGTIPINLQESNVDFLAGGAQKWLLGPIGCGYFYIRKELIQKVHVPLVGWTSMRYPENFDIMNLDFAIEATRFEPGLPSITSIGGLNHSLKELRKVGWETIYQRLKVLTHYLHEQMQQIKGFKPMVSDVQEIGPIASFTLPEEVNSKKLLARLKEKGITVTARGRHIRASPHFYNSKVELDTFLEAVDGCSLNRKVFFPEIRPESQEGEPWILLNGATGILGQEIARYLSEKGFNITGIGQNKSLLQELKKEAKERFATSFEPAVVDLREPEQLSKFCRAQNRKYVGLINASGVVETELLKSLDSQKLLEMFQVNFFAPTQLMQQFITHLSTPEATGILNIVSASGRCGYPLLGGYGASNAALWTASETLDRELRQKKLSVTTFVCPSLHSRMQKRIGRSLLRYFKMGKEGFNYAHPEEVARKAVDAFLSSKRLVIGKKSKLLTVLNAFSPKRVSRKIEKLWCVES